MSAWAIFALTASGWLAALGCFAYFRSEYHRAKAEVYQEFADTFSDMSRWAWVKDKERKKREQKRGWMRLTLCDPTTADALRDALADADRHWNRGLPLDGKEEG
jgi:hypothetical protein